MVLCSSHGTLWKEFWGSQVQLVALNPTKTSGSGIGFTIQLIHSFCVL